MEFEIVEGEHILAAETEKELQQLKKRFEDLAERSWQQNLFTFSPFLSLAEQNVFFEAADRRGWAYTLFGGMDNTERQMVRFGDGRQLGYEQPFPIVCLCIRPLQEKFADDFTHRDFLGALMNLGIDRSTVGDIFLDGKRAWVFCNETIAPYIQDSLTQVKHTSVKCVMTDGPDQIPEVKLKDVALNVAGLRCDNIVAEVYHLSRSESLTLFKQKKVYVNGKLQENNSYQLKPEDLVSVRGFGRFIFRGENHTTKKGRLSVSVSVFG